MADEAGHGRQWRGLIDVGGEGCKIDKMERGSRRGGPLATHFPKKKKLTVA
jgi:hypothetical protein